MISAECAARTLLLGHPLSLREMSRPDVEIVAAQPTIVISTRRRQMGIFTPAASDLDLALVAAGFVVIGFIIAYVVVPFAVYFAGTQQTRAQGVDATNAGQHFTRTSSRRQ